MPGDDGREALKERLEADNGECIASLEAVAPDPANVARASGPSASTGGTPRRT